MRTPPRILLLQARNPGDPVRREEHESFATKGRLPIDHIITHDLLQGPPSFARVRQYDALMMGGSGEFYVSKGNLPRFQQLLELMAEVVELGHPTFASCFGFQCMVRALGGEIVHDPDAMELGTYDLTLTRAGTGDALLGRLPSPFAAQLGHKDRATRLPPLAVNLASSDTCRYEALRIPDKPIWATQFHPELTCEENRLRLERYMAGYVSVVDEQGLKEVFARFRESPDTPHLISNFIELVFG